MKKLLLNAGMAGFVFSLMLALQTEVSAVNVLDENFASEQAAREDLRLGKEWADVIFPDPRGDEEDARWMTMVMKDGWTYLRSSNVSVDGQGYSKAFAGLHNQAIYVNWKAEVAWTTQVLYNDGNTIVELRYFFPNNNISLLESKVKVECKTCIDAGTALRNYATAWKKEGEIEDNMAKVENVIGNMLDYIGIKMQNLKVEFKGERSQKILEHESGNYKGVLKDSLFSNAWYLIVYNVKADRPDKLVRVVLEGDKLKVWKGLGGETEKNDEMLRRQAIVRGAYLMDASVLPEDKKLDEIGKEWMVPASAFGLVVGNDLASDLDEITGSIKMQYTRDQETKDSVLSVMSKKGPASRNRIEFVYKPKGQDTMVETHKSISLDPEAIQIYFDRKSNFIHRVELEGKAHMTMAKHIDLWPNIQLSAEPYIEAEYESRAISRDLGEKFDQKLMVNVAQFIQHKLDFDITKRPETKEK